MNQATLVALLLAATVEIPVAEFVEVQALSADDLRKRFALPASCDPMVTALASDASVNRITVAVECRGKPAAPPATGQPRSPARRGS